MCRSKSFFKRIVPFFLTFAVGLLIASFFVSVAAPNFRFGGNFRRHKELDRMTELENQRLREENFRLKQNLAIGEGVTTLDLSSDEFNVPPPMPMPPPAPTRNVRR